MENKISVELFAQAQKIMPGGVNSPVRAFKSVNSSPLFIKRGKGAIIEDEDGNSFIDYLSSWGPLILGHLHAEVAEAIRECLNIGTSFGAPTERENILGAMIIDAVPSIEMVRLVNSGTEATMSAARLARAYTGRDKIVKFEGCYHGHGDMFLIKAGSGALTHGVPTSPGVTKNIAENTINATYNNLKSVEEIFESEGNSIAAVFVEPVAGNMGVVPPEPGFLEGLREITEKYQALLIFDEVITGFRLSYGGAQQLYSVMPDITCLGKIIGGGLPVGAYGGKEDVMKMLSPAGPVYQAGTLSGNPLAVSAGIATLKVLKRPGFYQELNNKAQYLAKGLKEMAKNAGADVHINRVESMLCCFFSKNKVVDFKTASASDTEKYTLFFRSMLEQGIYLAPAQFESTFISLAHTQDMLDKTIEAAGIAFKNAVRP